MSTEEDVVTPPVAEEPTKGFIFQEGTTICVNCVPMEDTGFMGGGELAIVCEVPAEIRKDHPEALAYRMCIPTIDACTLVNLSTEAEVAVTIDKSNIVPANEHLLLSLENNKMLFGFPPLAFGPAPPRAAAALGLRYVDKEFEFFPGTHELRFGDVLVDTISDRNWLVIAFYMEEKTVMVSLKNICSTFNSRKLYLFLLSSWPRFSLGVNHRKMLLRNQGIAQIFSSLGSCQCRWSLRISCPGR